MQAHGLDSGVWCPYGAPGDFPPDQRTEDGLALCFDTPPLDTPMEILGFPEVTLMVVSDKPNALIAVRLCDVAPGGASTRVSYGLLNLTHRESHEFPQPLEPGQRYTVTVQLNAIGHSLPAGHRWRVAVSPTYWPMAWPSPEPVRLSVFAGAGCRLSLPARAPRPEDAHQPDFGPAEGSAPLEMKTLRAGSRRMQIEREVISGRVQFTDRTDSGSFLIVPTGVEYDSTGMDQWTIVEGDPLSATSRCDRNIKLSRNAAGWRTEVKTSSTLTADAGSFILTNVLEAFEGDVRVFAKTWTATIPRDHI
jgi:hypothetical protein